MFRIRLANEEDHQVIADFQTRMANETEGLDLDRDILTKGVLAVFRDAQKGKYLVVEDEGKIIASMLITYEWSDWRNQHIFWLQSVFVIPEYRGKQVFSLMFDYVKKLVNDDDNIAGIRLYVDNTNAHALKVYNAVGMDGEHYNTFEWMRNG